MSNVKSVKKPKAKHKFKDRNCLMCRREFKSSWPGERVCLECKKSSAWKTGSDDVLIDTRRIPTAGGTS